MNDSANLNLTAINPFYGAHWHRGSVPKPENQQAPVYAKLPLAPLNTSPVPHLTSLYHFNRDGEYGDPKYPGNCGGQLTRGILTGAAGALRRFGFFRTLSNPENAWCLTLHPAKKIDPGAF
jgi:hypothetical protein